MKTGPNYYKERMECIMETIERIGPFHYEGWTCDTCKFLTLDGAKLYCKETYSLIDLGSHDTPSTCPYIRDAVVMHVRGETDEDYL